MNKKFYTSDLHIGHKNVISMDNRPFKDLDEMHSEIIKRWNSKVDNGDIVYILGDCLWRSNKENTDVLKAMNGQKFLIKGNHCRVNKELEKCFVKITPYMEIKDNGRLVVMSHYPIHSYNRHYYPDTYNLYGHVHKTKEYEAVKQMQQVMWDNDFRCEMFNVGCMLHDYYPMTLDELIEWDIQGRYIDNERMGWK